MRSRTGSNASSRPMGRTESGWPTSPTCRPGRVRVPSGRARRVQPDRRVVHGPSSSHRAGARGAQHGAGTAPALSCIIPGNATLRRLWQTVPGDGGASLDESAGDCYDNAMAELFRHGVRAHRPAFIPYRPRRAWRSSNSSKAGTTHAAGTPPWVTSAPTTTNATRRRQRRVQCATFIVRPEGCPVLAGAESQRERYPLQRYPIHRSWGRLYVHRLSPNSGLEVTAINCPLKRGKSIFVAYFPST